MKCRARCGRSLTDPESQARGYGRTCWSRLPAEARAAIEPPAPRVRAPAAVPVAHVPGQTVIPIPEPLPTEGPR